ncbi:flagellar assembly protein A [Rugamonas apoptosis]|uniref:flagellar assembly protein A n=1 Tax=Rugamonas apoptosis TaxID=2758570 RepID=UPI002883532B|nr:flagellar assembly protein A [Rugamonas apoptosis]
MVSEVTQAAPPSAATAPAGALPAGLIQRTDGVYVDLAVPAPLRVAAVNQLFLSHCLLTGLDYGALIKALYDVGPALPPPLPGQPPLLRVANGVAPFMPARQALYKTVKMGHGYAEYFFAPIYLDAEELPDGTVLPERQTKLDVDEFVADLWLKGVRFGIDVAAVAHAISSGKSERITVARELEPAAGQDAVVVEVSQDIHRSDAPRERADGRVDLLSFQNRFPQIKQNMRLLKKLPCVPGLPGYDLAGMPSAPDAPKDLELRHLAGDGTAVEQQDDGEYLISTKEGFLSVDAKSHRIAITDKIVSKEGVSGRTTGNLELAGGYEEFGDVQEMREVHGSDITVHGDVYGNIHSKGGQVILDRNLVGGNIHNAAGDIHVKGVASGAVLQTHGGKLVVGRAENCVLAGTSVEVGEASNCEIVADEVRIGVAEGCAIAGRNVEIESCGPRKRTEMVIYVLVRDVSHFDQELADLRTRSAAFATANVTLQAEIDTISQQPDVRRYLALAAKLRTQELTLTPEQGQHLRKIAGAVAAEVQALGKLTQDLQAGQTQHKLLVERAARVAALRAEAAGLARCGLHMVAGDTLVRTMPFQADSGALYHLAAKDIKLRLRGTPSGGEELFARASGSLDWHLSTHGTAT